jgi:hypothetical protein
MDVRASGARLNTHPPKSWVLFVGVTAVEYLKRSSAVWVEREEGEVTDERMRVRERERGL